MLANLFRRRFRNKVITKDFEETKSNTRLPVRSERHPCSSSSSGSGSNHVCSEPSERKFWKSHFTKSKSGEWVVRNGKKSSSTGVVCCNEQINNNTLKDTISLCGNETVTNSLETTGFCNNLAHFDSGSFVEDPQETNRTTVSKQSSRKGKSKSVDRVYGNLSSIETDHSDGIFSAESPSTVMQGRQRSATLPALTTRRVAICIEIEKNTYMKNGDSLFNCHKNLIVDDYLKCLDFL